MHDLLNPTLGRRAALRRLSGILGGIATAPLVSSLLGGCTPPEPTGYAFATLDAAQQRTIAALVDQVIPATDTPGAAEAGVPAFVDKILSEWAEPDERQGFLDGLAAFDARATEEHGAAFAGLDAPTKQALVEAIDAETYAPDAPPADPPPFFRMVKELTVVGYYTSRIGATEELRWNPAPGRWNPDLSLTDEMRAWA
ncbi:MAG: gluconate 2-dehydrogenase subunit 3 family protein [Bacteroidota bacterium]